MSHNNFDVIIIGGSYSGLAAGMALGRALKKVLIIDSGNACNSQTPYSHNFLTNDGKAPKEINNIARQQVQHYETIVFLEDKALAGAVLTNGFQIQVLSGQTFYAKKLIFATGIKDILPPIPGLAACWGISVLHCPFCHGYEVRNEPTGILGNGVAAYEFSVLISNWTNNLTVFTNGTSTLTVDQTSALNRRKIKVVENEIEYLIHTGGHLEKIAFKNASPFLLGALYSPAPFEQHCQIPGDLGCQFSEEGYIIVDAFQETTVPGIFACGDNTTKTRTVANAVAMGTTAGMSVSKKIIMEEFNK